MTPIEVLEAAARQELTLSINGNKLRVTPSERLTVNFARTLAEHKWHLLDILTWPFVIVFSEILGETVFFCEDESTKAGLIEEGAEPWSIYTRAELQTLCVENRVAPLTSAELRKVHEIKRTFRGRVATDNGD